MVRYAQLVIGPAGSGKSTYCATVQQHCESVGRSAHVVNLDPAADEFKYNVAIDVRELVALEDVMDELKLGPNGGLIFAMEYLEESLDDWLKGQLDDFHDDDYLVFDCPGQIELYSHVPVLRTFVDQLKRWDFHICAVYLIDSQFMNDEAKFIAGMLASLSAMVQLELPHINVLTKVDLLHDKRTIEKYLEPEAAMLLADLDRSMPPRFARLNHAIAQLVDDYSLVNFLPLDISDEDSIQYVLSQVDNAIQFGEDADVKIKDEPDADWEGD
ncbi:unnamed protein product [Closterium sp. Naga37s-1]|nr:unnamed protein product [Closterium sp. Naga37s-1]